MGGGIPDRVPVIPQICHPHSIHALGLDFESTVLDVVRDPDLSNRLNFECARLYGVDGMRVFARHEPADVRKIDGLWYGVQPSTGDILGRLDFAGGGRISPTEAITLNNTEDVDAIPVAPAAEILRSGRLDGVKRIVEEAGESLFISGAVGSFTVEYIAARNGKAQAMMDMLDRPDLCHQAQERAMQASIEWAKALSMVGVSGIYIGETFGGLMSPSQFEEFCLPYFRRFVEALGGPDCSLTSIYAATAGAYSR